jgi:drug/metabolite transporter (DMT)-like permease
LALSDRSVAADERGARALRADGLLLLTASIWGFAFVAQRVGMEHVGPFGFNGVRFALGSLVLLPLLAWGGKGRRELSGPGVAGGVLAGLVLFGGASFQQVALVSTTAGNAGFITGLYVVLVPILGLAVGHRTHAGTWMGAGLAALGLYLLSVVEGLSIARGDLLVLVGAIFWAGHVHVIGWLSRRQDPLQLACFQYAICALLSLAVACAVEDLAPAAYASAIAPILYGGLLSVGVAYTLQVVAQRRAKASHAAIILSLEAVFAALGGWLILGETLTARALAGCALMLSGVLLSQLWQSARPH